MRIKTLELVNFRPYYGNIRIDFPTNSDVPLCLIHGPNGFGKTSLLLALNWCLYGHDKLKEVFDYFNFQSRLENKPIISVRIVLEDNGREISITRRIQCNKPIQSPKDLEKSELFVFENGKKKQVEDDQILQENINMLIPREASQFSFFDGEKIEIYSSDEAPEATRRAIESVLGLTLLSQAQIDLEKLERDICRDRKIYLDRLEVGKDLSDKLQTIIFDLEEAKGQKEICEERLKSLEEQEHQLQEQLGKQETIKTALVELDSFEEKFKIAQLESGNLNNRLKEACQLLYLEILVPLLKNELQLAQLEHEEIFKKYIEASSLDAIRIIKKGIEDSGICICGREIDENHLRTIRNIYENHDSYGTREEVSINLEKLNLRVEALKFSSNYAQDQESYAEIAAHLVKNEEELYEFKTAITTRRTKIGNSDKEAITSLVEALDRVSNEKELINREIGSLSKKIEDLLSEKRRTETKLSQVSSQVAGLDRLSSQIEIIDKANQAFSIILNRSTLARQIEIQEASTYFFRSITNKRFAYERLIINADFSFGVETINKTRPPMELISAGEKQVTALSFLLGLNKYTNMKVPIFMDTPMGRLDEVHRKNVAKVLLELARQGQQIILLVTDTDVAFGVYDILKPSVGLELEIVHDQTNLTSKIERKIV